MELTLAKLNAAPKQDGGHIARISRLMALAIKFQRLVREGAVRNHRELADPGQISRARMSQIMRLSDLVPQTQEELLFLLKTVTGPDRFSEKTCARSPGPSVGSGRRKVSALGEQTLNPAGSTQRNATRIL